MIDYCLGIRNTTWRKTSESFSKFNFTITFIPVHHIYLHVIIRSVFVYNGKALLDLLFLIWNVSFSLTVVHGLVLEALISWAGNFILSVFLSTQQVNGYHQIIVVSATEKNGRARSWGRGHFFSGVFFRVSLDGLSERGTTCSLEATWERLLALYSIHSCCRP